MSVVRKAARSGCGPGFSGRMLHACLLASLLLAGRTASAQRVSGRLLDRQSTHPVPGAVLTLYAGDSAYVTSAVSDADGRWRLDAPRPGAYFIGVRRVGYRPWMSGAMALNTGSALDTVVLLEPLPVVLDPVTAQAAAIQQHLDDNGFFERQRGNFGHFVTLDAIERRQAARVTDLLTAIPGVQLMRGGGNVGPGQVVLRGSGLRGSEMCRPRVFVDGLMYARGDSRTVRARQNDASERQLELERRMDQAISLDDIGHPSTIAGIEVYRSASQVPVQFGGTSVETLCGVIVVWTRTAAMQADKP